jgi:hypothetical protein
MSAVFDAASANANFEFLTADAMVIAQPSISLSMLNNGQAVNRFQADETVQLQAILADATGRPIEGEIIVFASGIGTLNTTDALTDNLGVAQVSLSPAVTDIGATVLCAQTEIDNLSLIASINVEIQSVDALSEDVIRFAYFTTDGVFVEGEIGVSIANDDGSA